MPSELSLREWLCRHESKRLWQLAFTDGPTPFVLEGHQIDGHVFIIQVFQDDRGWDIYAPVSASNSATQAFQDAQNILDQLNDREYPH